MKKFFLILCAFFLTAGFDGFSQAKKPTIMVVPSDTWCQKHNYTTDFDDQGKIIKVSDLQRAVDDNDMSFVIAKVGEMMAERGFPLKDLKAVMTSIKKQDEIMKRMQNRTGGNVVQTSYEKIMRSAKADIVIQLDWTMNTIGPQKSVSFLLKGLDAYTNKQIASASDVSKPAYSAETQLMLIESVRDHIGQFNNQLQSHFDDLFDNGREVVLYCVCGDDSEFNFSTQYGGKDFSMIVKDVLLNCTVKGRFSAGDITDYYMGFEQVRIPLYSADNKAMDVQDWVVKVVDELKSKLGSAQQINPKVNFQGLGEVFLVF